MIGYANTAVEAVYRSDWGRIVATLIRLVGDFDLAEESAQEALLAAIEQWPLSGVPESPRSWIIQAARNKAIDRIRRQRRFAEKLESLSVNSTSFIPEIDLATEEIPDDRLRLIFTCCHPALSLESQVALTLRTLCGLETQEIARAFLLSEATVAQRLVRAKRKIRDARIPYVIPQKSELPSRIDAVLTAIYLVFNEGYSATRGSSLIRTDLCVEAIRLGRLVRSLMAPEPPVEATGLLALMLLHDSRRHARHNEAGDLILLEDQDRTLWDKGQISEALPLVAESLAGGPSPFSIQAAIAALHCQAVSVDDTNWPQIVRWYELLERIQPSPVVLLNRAVAVAMAQGPEPALALIDASDATRNLEHYHLLHAVRADLLRRIGAAHEAAVSYRRALALATNESERRFLERRLREIDPQEVGQPVTAAEPPSYVHYIARPDPQSHKEADRDPSSPAF